MNTIERKQLGLQKARQLGEGHGSAVELMAGESAKTVVSEAKSAAWPSQGEALVLKCTFGFTEAPLWILASEECWSEIAKAAVAGAGIEDADADLRKQTWRELASQAASPLIADWSQEPPARLSVEESRFDSVEQASETFAVELTFGSKTFPRFYLAMPAGLVEAFAAGANAQVKSVSHHAPATLDRLLDVELPLSVSFGRTNVPVQDILRLASGSIIELNCPANDLVEIVVNNCMIARGEVVVIEGNYGVRVREIVSRGERLALQNVRGAAPSRMRLTA